MIPLLDVHQTSLFMDQIYMFLQDKVVLFIYPLAPALTKSPLGTETSKFIWTILLLNVSIGCCWHQSIYLLDKSHFQRCLLYTLKIG